MSGSANGVSAREGRVLDVNRVPSHVADRADRIQARLETSCASQGALIIRPLSHQSLETNLDALPYSESRDVQFWNRTLLTLSVADREMPCPPTQVRPRTVRLCVPEFTAT